MPGTVVSDGPTVSLSFANNFWGKDDAGVVPLLTRMQEAKTTGDELKAFYTARAQIEEEYAKKLLNLAKKPLGSTERGTLRMSLDVVRGEVESMGKAHQNVAHQMKSELDDPLGAFASGIKERRKIVQGGIEKLLKMKMQQTHAVNKARDKFEQDCLKIKGYLAQGHMVMGQEERKNKAKLEKTQIQMSTNSQEYETAVKILEETTGRWNREWKAACDKFQDLEEERIDFFKSSMWSFANIASAVCVSDDQSCEKVRLSLEDCEVEKDIMTFIKDHGTGQEIPDPPKYINFCRGDIDDAASDNGSDNENYSVAQFARTMNPSFRTSSPQPSTYESHHDPDSSLREDMGLPQTRSSLQGDEYFNARGSVGSGAPPPLNPSYESFNPRGSTGSGAPPPLNKAPAPAPAAKPDPYADAPRIPHNPYPSDGMTQFCRIGPPSERSSIPSPVRASSAGSQEHSDYTNPTSLSDMEGQQSPVKQYNGSALSGVSSVGDEDAAQKKKAGGFFQSHSPFRRRSNKSKEALPSANITPSTRNTWAPAPRTTESANTSPTRPFGAGSRASTWQQKKPSPSPEPDPVDPRADYQLGIGNNVFDVANPSKPAPVRKESQHGGLDPIAQALAELKGVTKHASVRTSADRHYGMGTPAPQDFRNMQPPGAVPTPFANNANRATPPPAYDPPPMSRLGAPQPAHTKKEMQKATERYMTQKRDIFGAASPASAGASSRPGTRGTPSSQEQQRPQMNRGPSSSQQEQQRPPSRALSPAPLRSASPRPFTNNDQRAQTYRAPSPNPYGAPSPAAGAQPSRPRANTTSPIKQQPSYSGYASRGGSPGYANAPRAASPNPAPNPAYARSSAGGGSVSGGNSRPPSSRGSEYGGGAMALQLAQSPASPAGDPYGSQRGGRPQSRGQSYNDAYGTQALATRTRSQSQGVQRQYTKEGRPIVHYSRAMYMYQAAIPEELSFAKGDILAVLRIQDDGWWEAEVVGKNGRPGLVPSNYLKNC